MQYEIRQCNRQNFCGCFCRMPGAYAKNSEKLPAPSRMYRGGRESRAGKPRQSPPPCGEAQPKPAAVRGSPAKVPPCGEATPKLAAVRGSPAKARRRAGKPRQSSPLCGEAPPKPAAGRGNNAKPRRRAGKPRQSRRRAGKPRQSPPLCGEAPPKPAAGRGSPAKDRRRAGQPAKVRRWAANRAEYKKSGGSYDPPLAWFIFVSLLKTNISLALVI